MSVQSLSQVRARGGRIQVDFNGAQPELDEATRPLDRGGRNETVASSEAKGSTSVSRVSMYTLLVLVLIAAAFYGGLRASDFIKNRASSPNGTVGVDPLQIGRAAFERGDYKAAATEFESVSRREPSNAKALYWFGRAQLEQRDYAMAAKSFEEVIARQPSMYDAYVQQAAAYEAIGEKSKAASALSRYAEERRKDDRGTNDNQR